MEVRRGNNFLKAPQLNGLWCSAVNENLTQHKGVEDPLWHLRRLSCRLSSMEPQEGKRQKSGVALQ